MHEPPLTLTARIKLWQLPMTALEVLKDVHLRSSPNSLSLSCTVIYDSENKWSHKTPVK